jgi:hypothetical protein
MSSFFIGCNLYETVWLKKKGLVLFCGVTPHRCILVLHGSENVIEELSNTKDQVVGNGHQSEKIY